MIELRIKEYLRDAGITQKQLSEKLGIAPATLSRQLSQGSLTIRQLGLISEALNVHYTALIKDSLPSQGELTCPNCGRRINIRLTSNT